MATVVPPDQDKVCVVGAKGELIIRTTQMVTIDFPDRESMMAFVDAWEKMKEFQRDPVAYMDKYGQMPGVESIPTQSE